MTPNEKIAHGEQLIELGLKLIKEALADVITSGPAPVVEDDSGGSNPPGGGQPGHP